ncbi:uncharacterized protein LY89DRAFT_119640 [Mollisia scopiformis]|uniref:Uncharacterized protein n=1 Tax=Mollisia scopiformis TaxID=149040 RepID=A0A194X3B9_MOLSC|nr:uncharacterized protein LY89DRAFT_119640 [Mollisia scopiformis]KUJ14695.1 hypothetical protein LY89DRAFT_119640 [Mollisia scopiformis]
MPEDTSDKSRKLNTPTIGDLIQWTSILPAHVQLVNLTVNQDPLGSRINYTISQDRTREALTLEAEGLADLTKQPQFKDDNASDKGPDDPHTLRPFSIEEPKPQAASTAKTTPSKQPTKTTEESDDGWEEGWEKKPNYGFDRLPAVPDPPQWADDPDPIGRLSGFTPQPPPPPRSSTSRPRAPPPPAPPRRPTRPAPQPPQPPRSSSSRPGAPPSPPPRPPLGEFNERTSKTDPIYYSPASEIRPRPTTLAALGYSPRLPVSLPPHPPSRVFEAPKDTRNPATRSVSVTYKRITQGGYYPRTGMDYISEGSEGSSRVTYTRPNREREKSPQRVNPFTRRVVEIESGSERGKKTARSLSRSSTESNPSVAASKTSDDPWATWGSTSKKKSDKSSQKSKIPVSSGNAPQRSSSPESWTRKLTRKPRSPSPPRRSGIIKVPGGSSDTINWRAQICELLKTGPDTADDALLESLLKTLKSSAAVEEPASVTKKPKKPKIKTPSPVSQILFRVKCHRTDRPLVYSDFPAFDENNHGDKKLHLKGKLTVSKSDLDNLDKERHGNLSFVVYKDFECCKKISNAKPGPLSKKEKSQQFQASEPLDLYTTESIRLISEEFCEAVVAITKTTGRIPACYPEFETSAILNAPYPWYYIDRRAWKENVSTLNKAQQKQVDLFVDYADYNIGEEYEKIDALLDKGLITTSYLDCLFVSSTSLPLQ